VNVFVDTSAFYALLAKSDAHHQEASERWRGLIAQPSNQLFTSNYVIAEACALTGNRLGRGAVLDFVEVLLPATHVLWVDEAVHRTALEAMLLGPAGGPGLVDCVSFALMHARGLRRAFSYDKHFAAFRR
jgi:uncharacterized protein